MNLFQRLAHRLFGWQYVAVRYGYDLRPYRVKLTPNGLPYVTLCGSNEFLYRDPLREGGIVAGLQGGGSRAIPLTFGREGVNALPAP